MVVESAPEGQFETYRPSGSRPVPGLGDAAIWDPETSTLSVQRGRVLVSVTLQGPQQDKLAVLRSLATAALGRV
jgi:hypothetical protein